MYLFFYVTDWRETGGAKWEKREEKIYAPLESTGCAFVYSHTRVTYGGKAEFLGMDKLCFASRIFG